MAKFLGLTGLTQVVTNIKDWANGLFVTKSRTVNGKPLSDNITLDASDVGAIPASQKSAVNGVASLDSSGKVPSTQLPSYVDDVIEGYLSDGKFYEEEDHTTEITGESSKIYVDLHSENSYRWGGTTFVEISKGITLGETASTAFAGDKGKVAYDHSQAAHAPANAEANVQSDWNEDDTGSDAYIKNKPTALPADGGNADTVNGHTVEANVPADAEFTDTTYNTGTDSVAGITKLYGATGENADGAMTQAAVTTALGNYALKTEIPTAVSELENDAGYQNASQVSSAITAGLTGYAKTSDLPTKVSDLTNDAGYLTEVPSEYVTDTELTEKGYQTSAQVQTAISEVTADILKKVDIAQGVENAGKVLGIDSDGNVTPVEGTGGGSGGNNSSADPLAGKHILFAGDSLVSGLGWKGGFANCLQEDHPTAIITNVAEAGALLTYAPDRPWIKQQLQENIAGKDILIFDGGFNDIIYPGKVMGTVPDDIAFNSNPATVADAFAAWLWPVREANPTMDIFYIIPCMYRSTQTGGTNTSVVNEFAEILKTICGYYSVGVIDLRFNGRVPLYSPFGGTTNPYMYDSLHPNELGYRKLAPFIDHEICKYY